MTSSPDASFPPGQTHRRRIHYVDYVLQKWMLIGLVVLEVIVLSIGGAILYSRLNAVVDANLYRIHFAGQPSMFSVLLKESVVIMGWLGAANIVALVVADRIWTYYVHGILTTLRSLLSSTRDLDLRADAGVPERHNVVAQALAWRHAERERHLALHESLSLVARAAEQPSSSDEFRAALIALRQQLPSRSD